MKQRESLTTVPCSICWGSTFPLSNKTQLRAGGLSRPKSTPFGTHWHSRWGKHHSDSLTRRKQSHLTVLPQEGALRTERTLGISLILHWTCWCLSNCLACVSGSLSHWAARSAGHDRQLSAEARREVHDFLPPQLRQERLLQGQAGEAIHGLKLGWNEFYLFKKWLVLNVPSLFSPFQCESSLVGPPARCWCVSSWNGKKIAGEGDLIGDSECHQEVTYWRTNTVTTHKRTYRTDTKGVWTQVTCENQHKMWEIQFPRGIFPLVFIYMYVSGLIYSVLVYSY